MPGSPDIGDGLSYAKPASSGDASRPVNSGVRPPTGSDDVEEFAPSRRSSYPVPRLRRGDADRDDGRARRPGLAPDSDSCWAARLVARALPAAPQQAEPRRLRAAGFIFQVSVRAAQD
jgi:hypothetical protein